ncbi:MAG: type II toxin-antitoxin system VapC family toxin [Promethearchaeota archaeon]|nr:MAG: type II toxin-antitoxin system VapC family toxin [Candidatus Lokiarchaeota archaeon]
MKNTIILDTGILSLYQINDEKVVNEIITKKRKKVNFLSSELNFIELFNHLCREKGKINAQIVMENLRKGDIVKFIPVLSKISIFAGELKCKYHYLSLVDSVICAEALSRKAYVYTTETHFSEVKNLKIKKFDF